MDESGTADRVDRAAHAREPVDILGISKRLQKDPRWTTVIEPLRTKMMRECRQKGMSKPDAQAWTYSELDRLYPPEVTDCWQIQTACRHRRSRRVWPRRSARRLAAAASQRLVSRRKSVG